MGTQYTTKPGHKTLRVLVCQDKLSVSQVDSLSKWEDGTKLIKPKNLVTAHVYNKNERLFWYRQYNYYLKDKSLT